MYGGGLKAVWKPLCLDLRNGNVDPETGRPLIKGGGTMIDTSSQLIFKYNRTCKPALANVNLDTKPGFNVAYIILTTAYAVIRKTQGGTIVTVVN